MTAFPQISLLNQCLSHIPLAEEYRICLMTKNRPSIIPIWIPDGKEIKLPVLSEPQAPADATNDVTVSADECDKDEISTEEENSSKCEVPIVSESPSDFSSDSRDYNITDSACDNNPEHKKIRCGTRPDCMEADVDESNAITVEWVKPYDHITAQRDLTGKSVFQF